jgi:hypothetical protein
MERLKGIATKVRHTVDVSGGGNRQGYSVTTTHICLLQIGAMAIEVRCSEPIVISEGDRVAVAGFRSGAMLQGLAYANESNGASGNEGMLGKLAAGTACVLAGGSALFGLVATPQGWLPTLASSGFLCFGLYLVFRGFNIWKATQALR